jgi:hypothetical protein
MAGNTIPEVNYLLSKVEKKYGRRVATTTDYEALSVAIEIEINDHLSASTLKRIWGYVSEKPTPRLTTLDILSRYIGEKDFREFCASLKASDAFESNFFTAKCLSSSDIKSGTRKLPSDGILIVSSHLIILANSEFEVLSSANSKLSQRMTDSKSTDFILGSPSVHLSHYFEKVLSLPLSWLVRTKGSTESKSCKEAICNGKKART